MMSTNFGAAAEDYARFRAGFPDSMFDRLESLLGKVDGLDVVDIGTGTGTVARGFAIRGAQVVAIDPDDRLLEAAKQLDAVASVAIEYRIGTAEAIPLADHVADVVCAGQCWHWFNSPVAAREIARITRPRGRVVIAHFDWLPISGNVVAMTERLIERHNQRWRLGGGNGFHPESVPDLRAAGFSGFENFSYEVDVPYTPEAWRGRIRASAGVGASLSPAAVEKFDLELGEALAVSFPGEILPIPHRVFVIVGTLSRTR
jgi:SAM-dependent methyltransferase